MSLDEITLTSTLKGCAAMFPATTPTPCSPAPGIGKSALKLVGQQCAGEISDSKAETAMKLMLVAGRSLSGKTLGIIGFGQSGRDIARSAHFGFGMKIVVHNRSRVSDDDLGQVNARQVDDMDHFLGQSDFVSLHCPADAGNRHLIDALRLNKMKPDAYLINTAGSELVDEEALADALWYDTIAGAGLDDTHNNRAICDRIRGCQNVVLLPHTNNSLQPARTAM